MKNSTPSGRPTPKRKIRCITTEQPPTNPCARCTKRNLCCQYLAAPDCPPPAQTPAVSDTTETGSESPPFHRQLAPSTPVTLPYISRGLREASLAGAGSPHPFPLHPGYSYNWDRGGDIPGPSLTFTQSSQSPSSLPPFGDEFEPDLDAPPYTRPRSNRAPLLNSMQNLEFALQPVRTYRHLVTHEGSHPLWPAMAGLHSVGYPLEFELPLFGDAFSACEWPSDSGSQGSN
ncbi:hypothetical protein FB451DRAFT_1164800 [Mycena latifolia]|nr:hypothetical protein FB451DRAFT_1164800 [Mycena latifolia]